MNGMLFDALVENQYSDQNFHSRTNGFSVPIKKCLTKFALCIIINKILRKDGGSYV